MDESPTSQTQLMAQDCRFMKGFNSLHRHSARDGAARLYCTVQFIYCIHHEDYIANKTYHFRFPTSSHPSGYIDSTASLQANVTLRAGIMAIDITTSCQTPRLNFGALTFYELISSGTNCTADIEYCGNEH